ncbi:siRNA-mediated silencing protein NRDE-2 protein [Dioscorea alata]|uniref:SiRNA-mediated silencing protein NRDE-2 protein n=1 Tax=Dioscorea alata TaxID=55571 RepID=A0ACB7U772_DIOAL|nr:siRNA-mediated silencing protein NRDE-2 protein [Dioscorea alata]
MEPSAEVAGEEEDQKPKPLFPLFPISSKPSSSEASQWLSNPSFTLDPSSFPTAPAPIPPDSDDDDSTADAPAAPAPPSYDLVASSPSPSSSEEADARRLKRDDKRRRRKKRKRDREKEDDGTSRKSRVRAWAGSETKMAKDYYFDSHGDRDNLVYGSLYKMDVARYSLYYYSDYFTSKHRLLYGWRPGYSFMDVDIDLDVLDSKSRAGGRYCSVKYAAMERHKSFKRVKIVRKEAPLVSPGEFIPLVELQDLPENVCSVAKGEVLESWEDEVLRRTREFNKMSREFPHDEKVWLDFAEFQDKIASTQPQKAARLQMLEKKISILEKAVELNPENEDLLLSLLKSYKARDSTDSLMNRWEKALMQHYDSCRLWKEFLLLRQGEFSRFKVSDMRRAYANAIQALSSACTKLCRQGSLNPISQPSDPALVQVELGLVDIFISLCRFEWQTGHHELATGLFQAEMEFSLFSPSLSVSSHSKLRLFEHFWNSNGARIGEDGAVGWSTWLQKEDENRQNTVMVESTEEADVGWLDWLA